MGQAAAWGAVGGGIGAGLGAAASKAAPYVGNWIGAAFASGSSYAPSAAASAEPRLIAAGQAAARASQKATQAVGAGNLAHAAAPPSAASRLPVMTFDAGRVPNIARNIQAALDEGHPGILTRTTDPKLISSNRSVACKGFCGTESPDEYPFASTYEGGLGARIADVPLREQRIQGGIMSRFYQTQNIEDGGQYRVRVTGLVP